MIAAAALLFCWPAFYNGFPLVYGDTASYLDSIDPSKTLWARQIFYTALLRLLHWRISLWPAIFAQALVTAHILYLTLRVLQPRLPLGIYLFIAAILALTTSLPWHTSALLPDFFTPVLVLAMFMLGLCRDDLNRLETLYLVALTAVAVVVHLSHIPLALGLIGVIVAARLGFGLRDSHWGRTPLLLAAPVLAAIAAHVGINRVYYSSFSLSPASSVWLLARFIGDGPARDYLREECPTRQFVLCAYLDELPADSDEFLWNNYTTDAVFVRAGGYAALRGEAREIVSGTIARYPGRVAGDFLRNSARQFIDIGTGGWLDFGPNMLGQPISQYIQIQFPRSYDRYVHSAQLRSAIPTAALAVWHTGFVVVGALGCAVLLFAHAHGGSRRFVLLCLVILAALVGNAIVTGGISAVHDRYQTRVIWLVVFAACAGVATYARNPALTGYRVTARRRRAHTDNPSRQT